MDTASTGAHQGAHQGAAELAEYLGLVCLTHEKAFGSRMCATVLLHSV